MLAQGPSDEKMIESYARNIKKKLFDSQGKGRFKIFGPFKFKGLP